MLSVTIVYLQEKKLYVPTLTPVQARHATIYRNLDIYTKNVSHKNKNKI